MKIIDMTHVMNVHTPGWVGYAGNKMYYAQNLQTQGILAQRIEMALHVGTHFDGAMHATDGRTGDMASLPLDYLVSHGVVVDLAPQVSDWSAITPAIEAPTRLPDKPTARSRPIATCRCCTGTRSPMSASAIGNRPPATHPATTRMATSSGKLVAAAQTSAASATTIRQKFISRVLPK